MATGWRRFVVVHVAQVPLVVVAGTAVGVWVPWVVGILGSIICTAGIARGWRWRRAILLVEAAVWLALPLVFGLPSQGVGAN